MANKMMIQIHTDGEKDTSATLFKNGINSRYCVSSCHPDDRFSLFEGCKIALNRLAADKYDYRWHRWSWTLLRPAMAIYIYWVGNDRIWTDVFIKGHQEVHMSRLVQYDGNEEEFFKYAREAVKEICEGYC
jgi:hypothetical protein